jgi:hypothetical protein
MRPIIRQASSLLVNTATLALLGLFLIPLPSCDPWGHGGAFSTAHLISADSDDLLTSDICPHMNVPLRPGRTVIYSGSFRLAWAELESLLGESPHLEPDSPLAETLNAFTISDTFLDEASYVAVGDTVGNDAAGTIARQLADRFGGRARPRLVPTEAELLGARPEDIVLYSYVFKHLAFETPFEDLDLELSFMGRPVYAFGVGPYKPGQEAMRSQIRIVDYLSEDDFIIELYTEAREDQLVLAKISPGATLAETVAGVQRRLVAAERTPATITNQPGDVLMVPNLNIELARRYDELLGRHLVTSHPEVADDLMILRAEQLVRFQMDEEGVRLREESTMHFGCSASGGLPPAHTMIFDRPFLIMLQRRDASTPYFAMWVGSDELLAKPGQGGD